MVPPPFRGEQKKNTQTTRFAAIPCVGVPPSIPRSRVGPEGGYPRLFMNSPDPAPRAPYRLLLVDDHPIIRKGLAKLLMSEPDLLVSGEAENAAQALTELRTKPFDLALVDVSLRGVSGIDLLKELKIHWPDLPALTLSMHDEMLYAERALRAGARGYIMKQESMERIIAAIRRVLAGQIYVSEAVNERILSRMMDGSGKAENGQIVDTLSNRELEVFQFIGRGRGTREIATEMHVSVKTVETYRAHIKDKLRLKSAPELMRFAVDWVSQQG